MFTGIVTDIGIVRRVTFRSIAGTDTRLTIGCGYDMAGVAIGASIACSGVCLTVVDKGSDWFAVDVSDETLSKTSPAIWLENARLNLERALRVGDELGGHIVTGHVDAVGRVVHALAQGGSTCITIIVPPALAPFVAAKGSITIDGVSLTVNSVEDMADCSATFGVNIIPHTAAVTTLGALAADDLVNLEIDVLARYLGRMKQVLEHRNV